MTEDAASTTTPSADAGHDAAVVSPAAPAAELDAGVLDAGRWQELLRGQYAVRAFSFRREGAPQSREDVLFVSFEQRGATLQLTEQVCASGFGWNAGSIVASAELSEPEAWAPRTLEVEYDGEFWSTVGSVDARGYTLEAPAQCAGESHASRQPEQVWIAGECSCATTPIPTSADDCRVGDPDGDQKPGYALDVLVAGLPAVYHVVGRQLDRYVQGVIEPNGMHSARVTREGQETLVGCEGTCDLGNPKECPAGGNYVWFAPLAELPAAGTWDCAAVLEVLPELFRNRPAPAFPQGC